MNSLKGLISSASKKLIDSDSPRLDAELIWAQVLGRDRTWLFTWPDYQPNAEEILESQHLISRRTEGEPIAYILSRREFWGLSLECDSSTLIPRPETELLVEKALNLDLHESARVLDLGTGNGAIALALAVERPNWNICAVELSDPAIELAQRNAQNLNISSVDWLQGSWFEPIAEKAQFDLIISNPPYVEENSSWLEEGDVRFEPRTALTAGVDGMQDIELIAKLSQGYLANGGYILIEHGFNQFEKVFSELVKLGYQSVQGFKDLAGLDRAVLARASCYLASRPPA
jgi:release factor glutamine methyltransferase|tara:strand:+ start:21961 stop:22824 length:864 start_codon:yes stop_codon:yes gene_type:complete